MMEAANFLARWLRERLGCPHCAYEAEKIAWSGYDPDDWS
jgi:hypothetical protein